MGEAGNVVDTGETDKMPDGSVPHVIIVLRRAFILDVDRTSSASYTVFYREVSARRVA